MGLSAGQRLGLARRVRVGVGGLEELADLLAELLRVVVTMDRRRMFGSRANDLVLLADDRQRAVKWAIPAEQSRSSTGAVPCRTARGLCKGAEQIVSFPWRRPFVQARRRAVASECSD